MTHFIAALQSMNAENEVPTTESKQVTQPKQEDDDTKTEAHPISRLVYDKKAQVFHLEHSKKIVQRICRPCAKKYGGVWPKNHAATFASWKCDACDQPAGVCSTFDYNWQNVSLTPSDLEWLRD